PGVSDLIKLHLDSCHVVGYPHRAQYLGRHMVCNQRLATSPVPLVRVGLQSYQITSSTIASASSRRSLPEIKRGRSVSRKFVKKPACFSLFVICSNKSSAIFM